MRLRTLIAALAALLAVLGLSACGQSKAGVAAVVGGHRISESDVARYITLAGPDADVLAQAASSGSEVQPRVTALSVLIRNALVEQTLAGRGGLPSAAELDGLRAEAFQTFLGVAPDQLDEFVKTLPERLRANGFSADYQTLLEHNLELETALIGRVNATAQADLDQAVQEAKIPVRVSPRYGTWDTKTLQLASAAGDGLPDFITFQGSSAGTSG